MEGPRSPGERDYNERFVMVARHWSQLPEISAGTCAALYFVADSTPSAIFEVPQAGAGIARRTTKSDEAHLPAEEAQASPCPRIPRADAVARRAAHVEAPPRQGPQETLSLRVRVGVV